MTSCAATKPLQWIRLHVAIQQCLTHYGERRPFCDYSLPWYLERVVLTVWATLRLPLVPFALQAKAALAEEEEEDGTAVYVSTAAVWGFRVLGWHVWS